MQVIFEDEDEGSSNGGANSVGITICIERVIRCMKGEYIGKLGIKGSRI